MKKKLKPVPLDVDAINPSAAQSRDDAAEPGKQLPTCVNPKYATLLIPVDQEVTSEDGEDLVFEGRKVKPVKTLAGLAGVGAGGQPPLGDATSEGDLKEGDVVYMKPHAKIFVEGDTRFAWKPKMTAVSERSEPGEIKLLDMDSIYVTFSKGVKAWLPACALLPCTSGDQPGFLTKADDITATEIEIGMLVVVRNSAKAVVSASPYTWEPSVNTDDVGWVTEIRRGVNGATRVRFGGYLWSLPTTALCKENPTFEGNSMCYLTAYSEACHRYNCRPNSELLKLLTAAPVTRIDLSNNYLGKKGLQCLVDVLCINSSITDLSLPNNALCHDSVRSVLDVLRKDKLITSIDLSGNHFSYLTGRGIKQLVVSNPHITSVRLDSTGIPDWMVKDISQQAMKNYEALWVK
eukprot:TRINITY_DN1966_c0_g1_i1.p1 TRINITY_DN1966_c0_g1~~TRINITY_DN1966_c0_g1_i1.p1  ORF type:complete len:405 (+),score=50.86 TRINITY_DN1966_c0_g1_i1:145-1359(+)